MDNRVSILFSDLGPERVDVRPILEGKFDGLPPLPSRTVRVFLSSTFSGKFRLPNFGLNDAI